MPTLTNDPTSTTIYVRVPRVTKAAVADYAGARGLTLTAAVSTLLDRGLEAEENEASIESLQDQVRAKDELLRHTEARLQALQALANQPLGACPTCNGVVTAVDVLVRRQCRDGHPLQPPEAAQTPQGSGLDQTQSLLLIGAVGLLLGAVALANSSG